jgi:hypothetical protein
MARMLTQPLVISAKLGGLPDELKDLEAYAEFLRGFWSSFRTHMSAHFATLNPKEGQD